MNIVSKMRQEWGWALTLLLAVLVAYQPALNGGFVWDDDAWTTNIAHLTSDFHGLWEMWSRPTALQQYYPLTGTTFWLDHQLWGAWTLPYHLENVALHGIAVLLFWRLLQQLQVPGAWLAAAILALHPMMVESVAWIAERKNVLSMVLFLAALLAYGRLVSFWSGAAVPPWPHRSYLRALVLFLAALLAKVSTFALPPVILLLAWWKRGRLRWREEVLPVLPFFLLAVIMGAGVMWLEKHQVGAEGAAWQMSFMERTVNACRAWWFYVGKLLWPAPLPPIHPPWDAAQTFIPAWGWPLSVLLLALAVWWRRVWLGRGAVVALLFFTGILLPVLGFLNVYGMLYAPVADRWVHLPCLGLIALFAAAVSVLSGRFHCPWFIPALACVLLPALGWLTWRQARLYQDNETLMRAALRMNPRCWVAAYNLGNILKQHNRADEAMGLFQQVLRLNPQHVKAHNTLATSLMEAGRFEAALVELRTTIALMPWLAVAHQNLGNCLLRMGKVEAAASCYQKAVELAPDLADAHNNLAGILYQQGNHAGALAHYQRVVALRPGSADAHGNLGVVLAHGGRPSEGAAEYAAALQLQPKHPVILSNLAWLLATCPDDVVRDGPRALACAQEADTLTAGRNPEVLRSLAAALAENHRKDEADVTAVRAARLAQQQGNTVLAAAMLQEVDLYRAGLTKRDPGLAPAAP